MIVERDLKHNWHPCKQMKDFESVDPLVVVSASGSRITLDDGRELIDGIASWWCKSLGHQHPRLREALIRQANQFEHVIFSDTTNATIVQLSEQLSQLSPALNKVMYAGDGSSAVEIAMKMSLHARQIKKEPRTTFIALENAYHGETVGAMSVSDLGIYRSAYTSLLFPVEVIRDLPYVSGEEDPRWDDCASEWLLIEKQLQPLAKSATAVIVEPIVQGAGGMLIYSKDFLRRLREWCTENHVHLILDEIMTGFGRTGTMLASQHAGIEGDFLCLGKGLTAGWMPMSAMLTRQSIYDLFYDDYAAGKSFLHSHTFSGHALAASVACEVMAVMREESICTRAQQLGVAMRQHMQDIAQQSKRLTNVRGMGAIVAADLINPSNRRLGYEVCQEAMRRGALLRPLGNTLYWLPPLTLENADLEQLSTITAQAIDAIC